ncbi:MAG: DNA-methyltransferase [Alphaproteobacteria bacterium]
MTKNSFKFLKGNSLQLLQDLPNNLFDAGVTSPPYNKQENKKGWLVKNVKYDNASDKKNENNYQSEQIAVLNELYRIIKPGGSFFYNHKIRWEKGDMLHPIAWLSKTNWTIRQEIIWDRIIAANIRGWRFWQIDERIYWLYKPKNNHKIGDELESRHAKMTSVWRFPPERKNGHPAPFPLLLPLRCLYSVMPNKNGLVIDPYVGSGTTLVAAKILGHGGHGIDISGDYIIKAKNRLDKYLMEKENANKEISLHKVLDTFKNKKENGYRVGKFAPNISFMQNELSL